MGSPLAFTLPVPGRLGLRATALVHGWYQTPAFRWDEGAGALWRAERWRGDRGPRLVRVEQPGGPGGLLACAVHGEGLDEGDVAAAGRLVSLCLGFDHDLSGFEEIAASYPPMEPAVRMGAGRWMRGSTLLEDLVKGICGTNVAWTQAVRMTERIATLAPEAALPDGSGPPLRCWPTAEEIARAGVDFLVREGRLGYRAAYVDTLVRAVLGGSADPESLDAAARAGLPDEDLRRGLLAFPGIGPATAHYLMTLRGRCARLSVDSTTYDFTARAHFGGRRGSEAEIRAVYARFGAHANRVAWLEYWLHHCPASPLREARPPERG